METEDVQFKRLSRDIEKPFRKSLGHAIRNEIDDLKETLLALTDDQITACLNLCGFAAGYTVIDISGREWPDDDSLHGIAGSTTRAKHAKEFGLTQQESYDYLKRAVLGSEQLDAVFPASDDGDHDAITLSFVITGQLLLGFHPAEIEWWDYLNIIENVFEISLNADLAVLPGLVFVSRKLGSPRVFGDGKRS